MAEPDLVHARFLGDSPVVMPDLAGRERCCLEANHRPAEPDEEGLIQSTLLRKGDVILLDRASAEGREDFAVLKPSKSSKTVKE